MQGIADWVYIIAICHGIETNGQGWPQENHWSVTSFLGHPSKVYQQRLSIHTTHFTGSVDLLHSSTSGANTMHLIQLYDKSPYEIRYLTNLFRPASHSHVRNRLVFRNIKHAAKSILNPRDILITVVLISSTALKVCS